MEKFCTNKNHSYKQTNKNIPHPPEVKWSNIEYGIKLFFSERGKRQE
jgi:hypothetical protein